MNDPSNAQLIGWLTLAGIISGVVIGLLSHNIKSAKWCGRVSQALRELGHEVDE